jgi:hypothetical protein
MYFEGPHIGFVLFVNRPLALVLFREFFARDFPTLVSGSSCSGQGYPPIFPSWSLLPLPFPPNLGLFPASLHSFEVSYRMVFSLLSSGCRYGSD